MTAEMPLSSRSNVVPVRRAQPELRPTVRRRPRRAFGAICEPASVRLQTYYTVNGMRDAGYLRALSLAAPRYQRVRVSVVALTDKVAGMGNAPMRGESLHHLGRDGAGRAKHWLDSTSRVDAFWVDPGEESAQKLPFAWPKRGQFFSFDLGGRLRNGELDGQLFYSEVKKYSAPSGLNARYKAFLARRYLAYLTIPSYADHFMWVCRTPHGVSLWSTLTRAAEVWATVIEHAARISPAVADPAVSVDEAACSEVADRLWLLILRDKQEPLVPSVERLGLIQIRSISMRTWRSLTTPAAWAPRE